MKKISYLLKAHSIYASRKLELYKEVKKLKEKLGDKEYKEHPAVKLARRVLEADQYIIPQNPNRKEYYLKGVLKKYRRYKKGLQRYRLSFCFSENPIPIIVYLYLNDKQSLRKEGSKTDPYIIFKNKVNKGVFSNDPMDPKMKKWIQGYN